MDTSITERRQIVMDSVESSQIAAIGHDPKTNTLAVRFPPNKSGTSSVYHYANFDAAHFAAFRDAESKGSHFGKCIKRCQDQFPYENVTALYSGVGIAPAESSVEKAEDPLFAQVPETTLRNSGIVVPAFLLGKYLSSVDPEGKAYVSATEKPAIDINFYDANKACALSGLSLITNLQYLALAQNICETAENWTGGIVGEGSLRQGLRKDSVDEVQANDYVPVDPDECRWFVLSTGERVYDVAGHLYSWVRADIEGDPETGLVNAPFSEGSPSIATAPYPYMEKGMGWIPKAGSDWSGNALVRGGCFYSDGHSGVFILDFGWPDLECDIIGFRCTKPQ